MMTKGEAWRNHGAGSAVCRLIEHGVELEFETPPRLSPVPISFLPPGDPIKRRALDEEVQKLIAKRVVEPVQTGELGFYSHLFLVPKKDGSWRPIIDLSSLNRHLVIPSFTMETPETIRTSTLQGDWAVSIDLRDAYFHLPVRESDRKYLSFSYKGEVWRFKNLCFGLATAPYFFTKVMTEFQRILSLQDVSIHVYLDDWLIRSLDREKLIRQTATVLTLCQELGLMVNWDKSDLTPKQDYVFLGYRFENLSHRVFPSEDRIVKILSLVNTFRTSQVLPVRIWSSLIGLLGSVDKIIPGGRLKIRTLQTHRRSQWKQIDDPDFHRWLEIAPTLKTDLAWWTITGNWVRGVPTLPPNPDVVIYTDASNSGWGAHTESRRYHLSGKWTEPQRQLHINLLELKAVVLAVTTWETMCQGKTVLIATDNRTVVAYLNHGGGTRSPGLNLVAVQFLTWCLSRNLVLRARHIPGQLNVLADELSRKGTLVSSEWTLNQQEFHRLVNLADFKPTIDLFALSRNAKLRSYVSPIPDKKAKAIDAMSFSWVGMKAYAYPPTQILPKVVAKILKERPRILLVTPLPKHAEWLTQLRRVGRPIKLKVTPDLLSQAGKLHQYPERCKLHAWIL